jgi:hypothetical protein
LRAGVGREGGAWRARRFGTGLASAFSSGTTCAPVPFVSVSSTQVFRTS